MMRIQFLNWLLKEEQSGRNYDFVFFEDAPATMERNKIYILGTKPFYWALKFECPCGCHEIITLNLLDDVDPKWEYKLKRKRITIYPSILRVAGCRSHFHIIKGRTRWVNW